MQATTDDRLLIALDDSNVTVRGTYHKPRDDDFETPSRGIGVLFLNGLYASRAGNGDAAVYWAGSFADCGYPSFRIDLPGYGDSDGDPPSDWLGFINEGGYAPVTAASIKELVARFHLSGVVLVGHCAGAVSALYAAASTKECKGLVLMDPYFHLPQTAIPKFRQQLNIWARKSRIGGLLSKLFDVLKQVRLRQTSNLPANANVALLRCWKHVASSGMPILFLKAPSRGSSGAKPRVGEFDYLAHVLSLAGRKARITVKVMEGANHSFSNHIGRAAVRQDTELWLRSVFPLTRHTEPPMQFEIKNSRHRSLQLHAQSLPWKEEDQQI